MGEGGGEGLTYDMLQFRKLTKSEVKVRVVRGLLGDSEFLRHAESARHPPVRGAILLITNN